MSISSINASIYSTPFDLQQSLNRGLEKAIKNLDFPNIKFFIKAGANPDLKIEVDFELYSKICSMAMFNDCEYFIDKIIKTINSEDLDQSIYMLYFELLDLLKFHCESEKEEGYIRSAETLKKMVMTTYQYDGKAEEIMKSKDEYSIFELALITRDIELINLLLEKGAKVDPSTWSRSFLFFTVDFLMTNSTFFYTLDFTEKNIAILDLMLSKGFSLESLLAKDETFFEIIEFAEYFELHLLLSYLKGHGICPKMRDKH